MTFHSHQAGNFLLQHTQSTWYTNSYSVRREKQFGLMILVVLEFLGLMMTQKKRQVA